MLYNPTFISKLWKSETYARSTDGFVRSELSSMLFVCTKHTAT